MPMTSINVAEWTVEQVADWLSGLGPTVARYVPALRERGLDGAKLLTLRCDDLEYLGVHVIGHQELLLEAVEHLRNFQYEVSRECVQQLALRVSVVATTVVRTLAAHCDARLETQTLADVATTVHAVKPLVCWLDRWSLCGSGLSERKAALLKLSLEAATCAQRDRFAEHPARAVAAAAAATAATADYIIQDVSDPMILQPASVDTVTLRQGGKPLGFDVVPSFCGHHQLADIRFGSPAHASGAVHNGDEIVQVGSQCVIGWSGAGVVRACVAAGPELTLRLRRRAAGGALQATLGPALRPRLLRPAPQPPAPAPAPSESDESEALSPPASPTQLQPDHTRMYPPKPRAAVQRRHTISGDSSLYKRPSHTIEQFWQELKQQRWGREGGSISMSPAPDEAALYARDKAVSCSTGLELSPRPRTCLGVVLDRARPPPVPSGPGLAPQGPSVAPSGPQPGDEPAASDRNRGKLDKSHSTPAYDFDASLDEPGPLAAQTIPESPTTPTDSPLALHLTDKADRILDFKKSSSQIGEAIQRGRRSNADEKSVPTEPESHADDDMFAGERDESTTERILETINIAMMEHRRRTERSDTDADTYRPQPAPRPAPPPRPGGLVAGGAGARAVSGRAPQFPVLRAVPRPEEPPTSPLKPVRPGDGTHISVPLRHITKHDIRVIPSERHEMPAINSPVSEPPAMGLGSPGAGSVGSLRRHSPGPPGTGTGDIVIGAHVNTDSSSGKGHALSPTSAVRGIFPNSKSRSLKKKSSILAKRRAVPARALAQRAAVGAVWQRVRVGGSGGAAGAGGAGAPVRWARRQLLLAHAVLYVYRSLSCARAACMVHVAGCAVSAAPEVKSRAHAFKVYHTGTAFYFATDTRDAQLAWIQLIHRATLLPSLASNMDVSKQFSETDYSETESDTESPQTETRERDKDKDKDKSKFGSLKKLTHRMQRGDTQDAAPHSSTSLDRKYLRFFYRNKPKDDAKPKQNKQSGVPVPTDHYRSYRRVASPAGPGSDGASDAGGAPGGAPGGGPGKLAPPVAPRLPKPINYIHASNPNLLDFDNSDFVTKPTLHVPKPKAKVEGVGLVTLEQFMLDKQAEERRDTYSGRLLRADAARARDLRARLQHVVPDVIYGELCAGDSTARSPGRNVHGYEKIVYRDEATSSSSTQSGAGASLTQSGHSTTSVLSGHSGQGGQGGQGGPAGPVGQAGSAGPAGQAVPGGAGGAAAAVPERARRGPPAERWRDSLRRNDKVHWSRAEPKPAPLDRRYPHLQCPPTFEAETYSLLRPPHH